MAGYVAAAVVVGCSVAVTGQIVVYRVFVLVTTYSDEELAGQWRTVAEHEVIV
jgi:hypothetical protein